MEKEETHMMRVRILVLEPCASKPVRESLTSTRKRALRLPALGSRRSGPARRREVSPRSTTEDQRPTTEAFLRSGSPAEGKGKFRGGQSHPLGKNPPQKTAKSPEKWHVTFPPAQENPKNPRKTTIDVMEKLEILEKDAFISAPDR